MAKVKFKLNGAGVRELLQGPEMTGIIAGLTSSVQGRAESASSLTFVSDVRTGKNRVVGRVSPGDAHAYYANLKRNILLKALKGGS